MEEKRGGREGGMGGKAKMKGEGKCIFKKMSTEKQSKEKKKGAPVPS
jgi:hypothetical protein